MTPLALAVVRLARRGKPARYSADVLLAAAADRPDDDTPHLVLADYLDDLSMPHLAAHIRAAVAGAREVGHESGNRGVVTGWGSTVHPYARPDRFTCLVHAGVRPGPDGSPTGAVEVLHGLPTGYVTWQVRGVPVGELRGVVGGLAHEGVEPMTLRTRQVRNGHLHAAFGIGDPPPQNPPRVRSSHDFPPTRL